MVNPYPLCNVECVDEPLRECKRSESADACSVNLSKVKVAGVSTNISNVECGADTSQADLACEPEMCMKEESSELLPEFTRTWDYEEAGYQITDVQGRLLTSVNFWEQELQAPSPIIDWIKHGYKLPLLSLPETFEKANHKSALENTDFVSSALTDLENNHCILEVDNVPHICSPLSVVTNSSGKKFLVIDLRYLNGYLLKEKFKYEDLRLAMLMFQKKRLFVFI